MNAVAPPACRSAMLRFSTSRSARSLLSSPFTPARPFSRRTMPLEQRPAAAAAQPLLSSLEDLRWDNVFTRELPADASTAKNIRQVEDAFFSFVNPTPTEGAGPTTIISSDEVAELIGLDPTEGSRPEFALIFSGNAVPPGSKPYAQCYGGHQFGQLGDGRAICLGEVATSATGERWELQLKGAGRTPYSRFADGRAVLRSSLREYVASEAMAALGVPTTRALSLVATGDEVLRDMFYNGNAQMEPGAVVCRVARSFIRFGTFQLPVSRGEGQIHMAKELADFVARYFYAEETQGKENKYAALLGAVAARTAKLVVEWHRVGFVHGVLNTDNMSIVGDTIDYGPFGFLERFDPGFTPNTTDLPGRRYAFGEQPEIGQWNLLQLTRAFLGAGLITEDEGREGLSTYASVLTTHFNAMMAQKLGLKEHDRELSNALLKEMFEDKADYTNTWRALSSVNPAATDEEGVPAALAAAVGLDALAEERVKAWEAWTRRYKAALRAAGWADDAERRALQDSVNPAVIPRNHVLVGVIGEAESGNYEPLQRFMAALKMPYSSEGLDLAWLEPAQQVRMGVELLSCSS